jgi:hypothetical protein
MPSILTIQNQIQCPHGGQAILVTTNSAFLVDDSPALLESDLHVIAGCPFTVGTVYMPCVEIEWSGGAEMLTVDGVGVLLETSIGLCNNAAGAPQGVAIIMDAAPEVDAI